MLPERAERSPQKVGKINCCAKIQGIARFMALPNPIIIFPFMWMIGRWDVAMQLAFASFLLQVGLDLASGPIQCLY